jgi:thioredoxin reductase (NADPH)
MQVRYPEGMTATSPIITERRAQIFPILTPEEIARMRRFGTPRRFADGELVIEAGKVSRGMYVVLSGAIRVTGRDSHGESWKSRSTAPARSAERSPSLRGDLPS